MKPNRKPRKKNPKTGFALFIADLIALLDQADLPVYGKAGRHNSHSRSQLVCLDYQGRLNKVRLNGYGAEKYGLARIHFNDLPLYTRLTADFKPAKSKQAHTFPKGPHLKITCRTIDLPDMLATVAGLLTGEVPNTDNRYGYYEEPRAIPVINQRSADHKAKEAARVQHLQRIATARAEVEEAEATPSLLPVSPLSERLAPRVRDYLTMIIGLQGGL